MTIDLVLSDDWELRGDGSGNMRAIQFETLRKLRELYDSRGLKGSFNVEVMQQLTHRKLQHDHARLGELADEWDQALRDTYSSGHDVQLHIHPQWSDAAYVDGAWELRGEWSLLRYSEPEISKMVSETKQYLEALLQPVDPSYRCRTFRSGSWCIAPGAAPLRALISAGIAVDTSIVAGLHYATTQLELDYRELEEPVLPYYPASEDARHVGEPGPLVCVPTHSFHASIFGKGLRFVARTAVRRLPRLAGLTARVVAPADTPVPGGGHEQRRYKPAAFEGGPRIMKHRRKISDLAAMSYWQMREMLSDIRRAQRRSGIDPLPVVVENHTKDIGDFRPVEYFADTISRAEDIRVITLRELADGFRTGRYPVRSRGA